MNVGLIYKNFYKSVIIIYMHILYIYKRKQRSDNKYHVSLRDFLIWETRKKYVDNIKNPCVKPLLT